MMPESMIDVTNCDREAIHTPGNIQSHGFLVVLDTDDSICFCSDNMIVLTGKTALQLLGEKINALERYLKLDRADIIGHYVRLLKLTKETEPINPLELAINCKVYNLIFSMHAEMIMMEFEPSGSLTNYFLRKTIGRSVSQMLANRDLSILVKDAAEQVRNITGFDRVMVYRFAPDGHGEVVSESKGAEFPSWLGQHYPASDIPLQARELYKLNMTRLIADVNAVPSRIVAVMGAGELDLTYSQLRAVSPMHIEYLKNMGTSTSFSISLIYKKELWGLIACHHYSPRFIDYNSRESARLVGQILSSALEYGQAELNQQVNETFKVQLGKLARQLQSTDSIRDALCRQRITLLDIVNSGGGSTFF